MRTAPSPALATNPAPAVTEGAPNAAWLASSRIQPALAALAITYTVGRTQPGRTATPLVVAAALIPLFSLGELGRVTRWSSALAHPSSARSIQRKVTRNLLPWHAIYMAASIAIVVTGRIESGSPRFELTAIGVTAMALTIASMLSIFERTLLMSRRYRALTLCTAPSTLCAIAVFVVGVGAPRSISPWLILAVLSASILLPRLCATAVEVRTKRPAGRGSTAIAVPDGSSRVFFTLQIIAVLSFNADILLARSIGHNSDAVRLAILGRSFGPVLLIGSVLAADIWPRLAHVGADRALAWRLCRRVLGASVAMSLVCMALGATANRLLPEAGRPNWLELACAAVWYPTLAFGSAIGQALAASRMSHRLIRLGLAMCVGNVGLSLGLGSILGAAGFLLGSILSYSTIVLLPMIRILNEPSEP